MLTWLLGWWNLVFLVPLALALLYVGIYAFSGLTFGEDLAVEAHADADADADVDADADAHVEAGADAHADAAAHGDDGAEAHGDAHGHHGADSHDVVHADVVSAGGAKIHADRELPFYLSVLSWLGVGKAPLSVVLMVLFLTWGSIGLILNGLLRHLVPADWMVALASLPVAGFASVGLTKATAAALKRWMPGNETYAQRKAELIGTAGEALFNIDERFGQAAVRDRQGDLFHVLCRVFEGGQPIAKGERVLLVEYDARGNQYYVTRYELPEPAPPGPLGRADVEPTRPRLAAPESLEGAASPAKASPRRDAAETAGP